MKNFLSSFQLSWHTDTDKHKWYPRIRHDWAVIFLLSALSMIFFLVLHFYLYGQITKGDFFSRTQDIQNHARSIDPKTLDSVLADFSAKKERFDSIIQSSESPADPSLGFVPSSALENKTNAKKRVLLPQ